MQQVVQCPHAPGGLDLNPRFRVLPHDLEVRHSGPGVRIQPAGLLDESIPRGGLDKRNAEGGADLAQSDDVALLQEVVLKNNLENGAVFHDGVIDLLDLVADVVPVSAQGFADVDDHVDLLPSLLGRPSCLEHFNLGGAVAVREADDGADEHVCALEDLFGTVDEVWKEYRQGLDGQRAIEDLDATWGSRWRPEPRGRTWYSRRKVIWDKIKEYIENGLSEENAVKEVEKLRDGGTINKLIRMLQEEKKEKGGGDDGMNA